MIARAVRNNFSETGTHLPSRDRMPSAKAMTVAAGIAGVAAGTQTALAWIAAAAPFVALAVVVALAIWARKAVRPLMAIGLGLIIGGAIGNNLIDRIVYGAVADFIDVRDLYFPWIFNIADAGISVGVAFLLLDSFLTGEDKLAHPPE